LEEERAARSGTPNEPEKVKRRRFFRK
jgi:hypothetical protein